MYHNFTITSVEIISLHRIQNVKELEWSHIPNNLGTQDH